MEKIVARRKRYILKNQPLHVIQRGNNRQAIFFAPDDCAQYLAWLDEAAGQCVRQNWHGLVAVVAKRITMAWTLIALTACAPGTIYDTPDVDARVVDAVTGQPIEGVLVTTCAHGSPSQCNSGHSNIAGIVSLGPLSHRTLLPGPYDTFSPRGTATFSKPGYAERTIQVPAGISRQLEITLSHDKS